MTMRARFLIREIDERCGSRDFQLMSVSMTRGVVPRRELTGDEPRADDLSNYKVCRVGDIVVNRMSAYQGALGISQEDGIVSPDYIVFRPSSNVVPRWLHHVMRSSWFVSEMAARIRGIGSIGTGNVRTPRVSAEEIGEIRLPVPSREHQQAIADYLDNETTRIDALIAKKQRMIELIEMRRKVVVVVHVSGNDSDKGVRLRHVSRLVRGSGFPHEYQGLDEGDLPFFKVGDLSRPGNDPYLVSCGNWVSAATANSLRATVVPPGAVMFPKIGAALAGGVRRIATVPSLCDNNVLAVVPTAVEERYLRFWLSTVDLVEIANPGPVPSLDDDALRDLLLPVADRKRQEEIANSLDGATASMANAVTRIQGQLGLLREQRQALITAAVTGELEVPGVAA
jgi:type I restriction enzyme S subunit